MQALLDSGQFHYTIVLLLTNLMLAALNFVYINNLPSNQTH